jgi:DNA-binding transcriptional LysR family regulator
MNYTLHQLVVFLKVVETESITKAAEVLHLTQPAVSIQLKNFQEQFDFPLTEVVSKQVYITEYGKQIAQSVQKILDEVELINASAKAAKDELAGKLKISVVSTGKYVMPYFLADFMNIHPKIELQIDVTNKSKVLESLQSNEVDFALVSVLPEQLRIEKIDLLQNKLYLIGNQKIGYKSRINEKAIFKDLPLIFREQGSGTRYVMERFIERNKLPILKKMELTTNEAVKQAVIAGLGFSIMPLIGIKNELINKSLYIIPVVGFPIKSMWHLIWLKGKSFSPAANAYLQFVKKERKQIVAKQFSWYEEFV